MSNGYEWRTLAACKKLDASTCEPSAMLAAESTSSSIVHACHTRVADKGFTSYC